MTKIKLCGLFRPEDVLTANKLYPDYVGFVFAPKSHRYVTEDVAARLRRLLRRDIAAVGVFVNAPPEDVARLLSLGTIDLAQLHGKEDAAYIRRLRTLSSAPVIQAFRIGSREDALAAAESPADYILFDSGEGGTGQAFDWSVLQNISRPYFLAGGLTADTVPSAIRAYAPYAVDVSSGIETNGTKDPAKMEAFVRAVRKTP